MTTYTEINGQPVAGIPEFSSVTTLDGQQIDYYDSDTGTLIPKQDWMKEFRSGDRFKEYTEIRERVQQTNKRFSQSHGELTSFITWPSAWFWLVSLDILRTVIRDNVNSIRASIATLYNDTSFMSLTVDHDADRSHFIQT